MLRNFAAADQLAVQTLILDGLRERWGEDFDERFNDDVRDIARSYLARGAEVVVIESDNTIVATGTLLDEGNGRARIVRMSVAASHRRQGLASVVVDELVSRASDRGFHAIDVATDTPWASAVALYLACGFTEVDRDEVDIHFAMDLSAK